MNPSAIGTAPADSAESFDYVVVGAGSAGAALAARLTEDPAVSVLLLEAGRPDKKLEIHIPAAFSALFRSAADWNYDTVPQAELNHRQVYWPRGKTLGGSSSINAMMWIRGFAADYRAWGQAAGADWSWEALLPYFRRIENIAGSSDPDHGHAGPMIVEPQRSPRAHTAAFLNAAAELGYPMAPQNTEAPLGFSETLVNQHRGSRFSVADAYLKPAKRRGNLTIRTDAQVSKVLFEGRRAVGVAYRQHGPRTARARREVILSGGSVNTPQLLMLSGIGAPEQLRRHGIDVVADSPEVGKNLYDHLLSGLIKNAVGDTLFTAKKPRQLADYLLRKQGMLTSNVAEAYGFVKTDPGLAFPDIEIIFAPVAFVGEGLVPPPAHGLTIGAILLQPESSGSVELASADPFAKPNIDPRYLSDPAGKDRATLTAGIRICHALLHAKAFDGSLSEGYLMPENADRLPVPELIQLAIDQHAQTLYHPIGTARMGTDPGSVVDPQLRVRGVAGLRVADASVMPNIIRGHTNAPSVVIGEKAAELLIAAG